MTLGRVKTTIIALVLSVIITGRAYCQDSTLVRGRVYEPLDGSVLVVEGIFAPVESCQSSMTIDQKHMLFLPPITAVVEGTTIEFPNSEDVIYHNVLLYYPDEERSVDLGTFRSGEVQRVTALEKGVIEVLCVIHTRMYALIVVTDNPYFSGVDSDGLYEIAGIPPGSYKISCWSVDVKGQRYRKETKDAVIPDNGTVVDF